MYLKNILQNLYNFFFFCIIQNGKSWLEDINGFYVIDSDSTTLLGWLVGEFVPEVELLDDQIVENGCMFLLDKFIGHKYRIPYPTDTLWLVCFF